MPAFRIYNFAGSSSFGPVGGWVDISGNVNYFISVDFSEIEQRIIATPCSAEVLNIQREQLRREREQDMQALMGIVNGMPDRIADHGVIHRDINHVIVE